MRMTLPLIERKINNLSIISLTLIFILFLSGCKMSSISMKILVPADINVPSHIKKVGIANRSLPDKENKWWNIAEGFITGESIFADREGSENTLKGLANQLNNSPRFTAVIIEGIDLRGSGTRLFPEPLNGEKIDELCKRFDVDALILLETFDSDIRFKQGQRTVEKKDKEGRKYNEIEYLADIGINVRSGWRIYDFQNKTIVDENVFTDEKGWNGTGRTPQAALNALPSKRRAINDAGFFSGTMYGRRISPGWTNVSRSYFKKGTAEFKVAKRFVKTNNWDGAGQIWENYINNNDPKVGGRATYNMAVLNEVKGDLNKALEWANKSYQDFGLRKAKSYIETLKRRISDEQRLDKQMN